MCCAKGSSLNKHPLSSTLNFSLETPEMGANTDSYRSSQVCAAPQVSRDLYASRVSTGAAKQITMPSALVNFVLLYQNNQSLVLYKEKIIYLVLVSGSCSLGCITAW